MSPSRGRKLRGLTGRRIVRALGRAGWYPSETSGKHFSLEHDQRPGMRVTIPIHGGRAIPVKTVLTIIKQAGLTPQEFEGLL